MANMNSMLGLTPEEMEIARKQKYAESLRQQSEAPMQGQMVGRTYVPPSWTQGLAKMLSAYGAHKADQQVSDMQKQFGEKQRADLQQVASALMGTPEQKAAYQADNPFGEDLGNLQTVTPAQPGNRQAAMAMALKSSNPALQQFALQDAFKTPEQTEYSTTPQYDQSGRAFLVNKSGQIKYLDGVQARDKAEFVNGVAVNPYQTAPGTTVPDYNKPFMPDGKPNPAYQRYETTKAEKGATRVGINNITTQEGEQSKTYGGGLGDVRIDIQKAGFSAPSRIANLNRMEQLLDGVEGGRLAKTGMTIASAAKSLGMEIDPRLGDKEAAEALAVDMALKMKEPGTGPMTDKDFDNFMTTVPSLAKTSGGRKQIITTLRAKATRDMEVAKRAREYARTHNGVIDDGFLDEASDYMAKNPIFKQPASSTARARADNILGGGK